MDGVGIRLVTVEDAAPALEVSTQRVYELIRLGILPPGVAVRLGRQVRLDADALAAWLKAGGQALPGGWRREPE